MTDPRYTRPDERPIDPATGQPEDLPEGLGPRGSTDFDPAPRRSNWVWISVLVVVVLVVLWGLFGFGGAGVETDDGPAATNGEMAPAPDTAPAQ